MITYIPAREWISARKQKPNESQEVLGLIESPDEAPYIDIVQYDSRDGEWMNSSVHQVVRVTWWCELPKMPYFARKKSVA